MKAPVPISFTPLILVPTFRLCISSTGGSLPEVAGDGAIYFDPKNFKQIQQAATAVLYNPATKEELIQKGAAQLAKFSWDKCRNETYEVYKKVVSTSGQ